MSSWTYELIRTAWNIYIYTKGQNCGFLMDTVSVKSFKLDATEIYYICINILYCQICFVLFISVTVVISLSVF